MANCPCGLEQTYEKCCAPFINGKALPPTAEALMRSRYSAFVKGAVDYIVESHHPDTRSEVNPEEIKSWSQHSKWLGLEIREKDKGAAADSTGQIEFVCRYEVDGQGLEHHELSDFKKEDGRWYFVDGKIIRGQFKRQGPKIGRNDPCPCNSGKKFKKCCGA